MDIYNKNILFLGSSVTYGSASEGISFVDIIRNDYGAMCTKEAVSGTTLTDINERSYISRLKKIDPSANFDLFICQLSTNDAALNIPMRNIEDAIIFIVNYVKYTFSCPIIFYTGTYFESNNYKNMVELLYGLQAKYSFHVLDLYSDKDMLSVSKEDYLKYMSDPIHPTYSGYKEWWTPKFVSFIKEL